MKAVARWLSSRHDLVCHQRLDLVRGLLGALWLADGLLQCQPYMFSRHFALQVLASAGAGQPYWVRAGVLWSAHLVLAHHVVINALFAAVQVGIGAGVLWRRTANFALVGSILWALGVWYFGEGLGGVAGGAGDLLTGSPGAVLIYVLIALVLLGATRSAVAASVIARASWSLVWVGGAALAIADGQAGAAVGKQAFSSAASSAPAFLAPFSKDLAHLFGSTPALGAGLAFAELLVGTAGVLGRPLQRLGALAGALLASFFWVFGQSMGQIWTGTATDPNSGVPLVLLAVALAFTAEPLVQARSEVRNLTGCRQYDHARRPVRA